MSSYNPTSLKATTIRTLTRRAQRVCDSPDSLKGKTDYLNNGFTKTTTARTLLDETLTVTLIPTLRPTSTLALLRQRLYRTSEAPLKASHLYYIITLQHTCCTQTYNHFTTSSTTLLLSKTKTNWRTDREQYTRSNAAIARPLTLVETGRNLSTRPTEHKQTTRNGEDNNHFAEHHLRTKHQINCDSAICITYSDSL